MKQIDNYYMYRFIEKSKYNKIMLCLIVLGVFLIFGNKYVYAVGKEQSPSISNDSVITLVNNERITHGLSQLVESELLNTVAQKKLDNMLEKKYFEHTSPDGESPWKWFFQEGYDFAYAGENLATDFNDVHKQHKAWMHSPKHKKNILDERFTHTGVAVGERRVDDKTTTLVVQVFATPKKVTMVATNFTPETYNVPDELFRVGNENNRSALNTFKEGGYAIVSAGAVNVDDINQQYVQHNSQIRIYAWVAICVLVVLVLFTQYRIFARKRKNL